jgi:enediyne biosynthesis protein E4
MKWICCWLLWAELLCGQGIASSNAKPQSRAKFSGRPWLASFVDITHSAGLSTPVVYGGEDRVDYLVETSSGGIALVDADADGWLDIFVTTGQRFGDKVETSQRLWRNQHDGTFADITKHSGLQRSAWQSGVAVGDYDADGLPDLLVTAWGHLTLWRNIGQGRFEDVSTATGLHTAGHRWWSGASFLDYDRDGDLDLAVAVYVDPYDLPRIPKPGANPNCNWKGLAVACGPRGLSPGGLRLFRNDRGRFTELSTLPPARCFGMTVAAADFSNDGWPDLYVACDSSVSLLFVNQKNGRWLEQGIERGVALNEDGREQAGMGLGIGDFNLDGRLDIVKTHFADDTHVLYRSSPSGDYTDVTLAAGLAVETRYVGWGASMSDFDNDGFPDIALVTGNVYPETERELPNYPYRSPGAMFRNLDGERFEQVSVPALEQARSSRGMATGDIDNDGDLDIVIWNRNAPITLLRNDLPTGQRNWLRISAPLGTQVTLLTATKKQTRTVLSQSSFYSVDDQRLHFGLSSSKECTLEIRWPDGRTEVRQKVAANQELRLFPDEKTTSLPKTR